MHTSHGSLLICALLSLAFPTATLAADAAVDHCFNLPSHSETRACLESQTTESNAALSRTEESFRVVLSSWDQEHSYQAQALANLEISTKTFVQYRAAQCELAASLAAGGNGTGDRRLFCTTKLNEQRIKQLQNEMRTLK